MIQAVEEGEIPTERYGSYLKLLKEQDFQAAQLDDALHAKRKQKDKALSKQVRLVKQIKKKW